MYDPLWEEHPRVKKIKAEAEARVAEAEARARVEAEARVKAEMEATARATLLHLRKAIVSIVKARFPELAEMAQQKTQQVGSMDVLDFLIDQITTATDEAEVRGLLRSSAA
ncbi:MAG TPA: hypothetical protein VFV38_37780 [Ktedonobacteraceae bacterium]|nr:hypothetical protein [Ktedonobacteraceae bacterium]